MYFIYMYVCNVDRHKTVNYLYLPLVLNVILHWNLTFKYDIDINKEKIGNIWQIQHKKIIFFLQFIFRNTRKNAPKINSDRLTIHYFNNYKK